MPSCKYQLFVDFINIGFLWQWWISLSKEEELICFMWLIDSNKHWHHQLKLAFHEECIVGHYIFKNEIDVFIIVFVSFDWFIKRIAEWSFQFFVIATLFSRGHTASITGPIADTKNVWYHVVSSTSTHDTDTESCKNCVSAKLVCHACLLSYLSTPSFLFLPISPLVLAGTSSR